MSKDEANKNIVVVFQHENWEDDGGAHDPQLITVTPQQYALFKTAADEDIPSNVDLDTLQGIAYSAPNPNCPCTLHDVFNIWHSD